MHDAQRYLLLTVLVFFLVSFLFVGCTAKSSISTTYPKCVGDLGEHVQPGKAECLLLPENEILTPFLVIRNNDNGSTLLLRKYVLMDDIIYNSIDTEVPSFYPNSKVDSFLNTEYKSRLGWVNEFIIPSEIKVTSLNAIKQYSSETESIERAIYILAKSELMDYLNRISANEGSFIKYFSGSGNDMLIALNEYGEAVTWWTRTPNIHDSSVVTSAVFGITEEGILSTDHVYNYPFGYANNKVRPAFSIDSNALVTQKLSPSGEIQYTLQMENKGEGSTL